MSGLPPSVSVRRIDADALANRLQGLAMLLIACVADGASIGFLAPVAPVEARAYWETAVVPGLETGAISLWVAEEAGEVIGTVQLARPHWPSHACRADVLKLLVHPKARRRGIARHLMSLLLERAEQLDLETLVLDTRVPDTARTLYESLGFIAVGEIPGFVLDPIDPKKRDATLYMYKALRPLWGAEP